MSGRGRNLKEQMKRNRGYYVGSVTVIGVNDKVLDMSVRLKHPSGCTSNNDADGNHVCK